MNTEITDNNALAPVGWVFYDGECRLCVSWVERLQGALDRRRFHLLPLQSPDASRQLCLTGPAPLGEMRLLLIDGRNLGGADAIVEIARHIWWAWPLWIISRFPFMMGIMRAGYRVLAANRHCANGVCLITHRSCLLNWLPLLVLPAAALTCRNLMPDWVFMWVLAFAIFFGCKWLTLRRAFAGRPSPPRLTALAYFFLWPGMDANAFITECAYNRPTARAWTGATAKTFAGLVLLWLVIAGVFRTDP